MRRGIDLDEVVADTIMALVNFHNERYGTNFNKNDFHSYYFWEIWGGTKKEAINKIYEFFGTDHFANIAPIAGSLNAMEKLKENGHELFVITGRQNEIIKETEEWIEKHFTKVFSGVHFANSYNLTSQPLKKSAICNQLDIEIIVEDDIYHANDLAEYGIKVLLFDQPWNQNGLESKENIERVYSWEEIIDKIIIDALK